MRHALLGVLLYTSYGVSSYSPFGVSSLCLCEQSEPLRLSDARHLPRRLPGW